MDIGVIVERIEQSQFVIRRAIFESRLTANQVISKYYRHL